MNWETVKEDIPAKRGLNFSVWLQEPNKLLHTGYMGSILRGQPALSSPQYLPNALRSCKEKPFRFGKVHSPSLTTGDFRGLS